MALTLKVSGINEAFDDILSKASIVHTIPQIEADKTRTYYNDSFDQIMESFYDLYNPKVYVRTGNLRNQRHSYYKLGVDSAIAGIIISPAYMGAYKKGSLSKETVQDMMWNQGIRYKLPKKKEVHYFVSEVTNDLGTFIGIPDLIMTKVEDANEKRISREVDELIDETFQ